MGLAKLLESNSSKLVSAVSMVVEAGLALHRGDNRLAALYLGAAALASQSGLLGAIAEILIRVYRWVR